MKNPFIEQDSLSINLYVNRFSKKEDAIDFFEDHGSKDDDQPEEFLGKSIVHTHVRWLLLLVFLGFGVLLFKLYYLQVYKGDYYSLMSEGNRVRQFVVPASRGIIFGRDGDILVRNVPRFSIFLTIADLPPKIEDRDFVVQKISELAGLDAKNIKEEIEKQAKNMGSYRPFSIKDNLEYEQALKLQIEIKNLAGVNLDVAQSREYLGGENFSPIMGYVGKITEEDYKNKKEEGYLLNDIIGKAGLEYSYEKELRGVNGTEDVEVDALGKVKKELSVVEPVPGSNMYLTIDTELQNKATEFVKEVFEKENKKRASVIILDPQTGEVLTLLSFPTYDNNLFSGGISQEEYQKLINDPDKPLFFRSISGEFPSGSTIKPVWSVAALEEGIINPSTSVMSNGGVWIGGWSFPDWKAGGHGMTNVRKAIAESVNTFYYYIGGGYGDFKGMGMETMGTYANLFNMGQLTGIDLPGEKKGFFPSPEWKKELKNEQWYIGDTYHVSIGQGDLLATPLQVAVWTSFFANGGKIVKPHIVGKIQHDGKMDTVDTVILRSDFIKPQHIDTVRQGMRDGVKKGSSRFLSNLPIEVGGKTGTAQWHTEKDNHAWWVGFAPYDDPKISITILVEEGGEGSKIAVPIAKKILQWWIDNRYKTRS